MAAKNREWNQNKRKGSHCWHKMMTARQKQRRDKIHLFETRRQSNLKRLKVERQQFLEHN